MNEISTKMAIHFEKNITAKDLSLWVANANYNLIDYSPDAGKKSNAYFLLWDIGQLLAEMIS